MLAFRRRHTQAVQVVRDGDLAGEAGVVLNILGEVEHRLLLKFWEILIQICDLLWKTYMKVAIFS